MPDHAVVTREQWLEARKRLLAEEKAFTKQRDALSQARRDLPWVRITKPYVFEGPDGQQSLAEIFEGRGQLIVYHFMFGPDWESGRKSCSFWADNFNGIIPHLNQRDVTFVAISRAPVAKLQAFAKRLGWTFTWFSSLGNDFNFDFNVSFTPDELANGGAVYNYAASRSKMTELPGISVFAKEPDGAVFHTYSCYARGLDMMNTAYHYLDLVSKGRDEGGHSHAMSWVRLHDEYGQETPRRERSA